MVVQIACGDKFAGAGIHRRAAALPHLQSLRERATGRRGIGKIAPDAWMQLQPAFPIRSPNDLLDELFNSC